MKTEYICIGGPLHLKPYPTDGYGMMYLNQIVKGNEPLKASEITSTNPIMSPAFDLETHKYRHMGISMFGTVRSFYVHSSVSNEEFERHVGVLCGALIDLYISS